MKTIFLSLIFCSLIHAQGFTTLGLLMGEETSFPLSYDNHTIALYDGDKGLTISAWEDQTTNGYNLTLYNSPSIVPNAVNGHKAVRFDGVDQYARRLTTPADEQPTTYYLVIKQYTWTSSDQIFDGTTGSTRNGLFQLGASPQMRSYGGSFLNGISLTLESYGIVSLVFNGASSEIRVNTDVATVGDAGAQNMQGITLGGSYLSSSRCDVEIAYFIMRDVGDNTATQDLFIAYLKNRFGL